MEIHLLCGQKVNGISHVTKSANVDLCTLVSTGFFDFRMHSESFSQSREIVLDENGAFDKFGNHCSSFMYDLRVGFSTV